MMRRSFTLLVIVAAWIGLMALPATAHSPTAIGPFTNVFDTTDPCTGEDYQGTVNWTIWVHEDGDAFDGRVVSDGTTDNGYIMVGGQGLLKGDIRGFKSVVSEIWYNAATGAVFEYSETFRDDGTTIVDETSKVCLSAAGA